MGKMGAGDIAAVMGSPETAVLVVDFQNDFMEGGALAVGGATYTDYKDAVMKFIDQCREKKIKVCFSQDWHPARHSSFASTHGVDPFTEKELKRPDGSGYKQMMWTDHCVQGTDGAKIIADTKDDFVVQKGMNLPFDSYSAFCDDGGEKTTLDEHLKSKGIKNCVCIGLATDFCVFFSATDAVKFGYKAYTIKDLCRGINPEYDWKNYTDKDVEVWDLAEVNKFFG